MQSKYGFEFTKKRAELHQQPERKYPTRGVIAFAPLGILGCDLVDYSKLPRKGYRYILNAVDVFSRRVESALLKDKTSRSIQRGFEEVFRRFGDRQPSKIWFDQEAGVVSNETKAWLEQRGIGLYHTYGITSKVSIAERFNRTQKSILYRYEMADDRHKWPDFVHEFNAKYNDTKHSTLGMTPNEAFASKQKEALMRNAKRYYKPRPAAKKPTPTLKPGDRVRIVNVRSRFAKGYKETWSREVFQVLEVKKTTSRLRQTCLRPPQNGQGWWCASSHLLPAPLRRLR